MTTLVTCFFDTSKYRTDNSGDKSIYWDESLLKTKHPMIIYGDKDYITFAKSIRTGPTEYHEMDVSELKLWSYYEQVELNRQRSWPSRDSRCPTAVHLITCNKIHLVVDAIMRNPFNTNKFGFIDCNVLMKMKVPVQTLDELLDHDITKFHIMAIGAVDDKLSYEQLYATYRYVVSGGFFLCTKEHGLKVADLFHQEFINTTNAGYGHGEEMIYTKIINNHFDLFELSYGDYSECVTNIFKVMRNHDYVFNYCVLKYSDFKWYERLKHCCRVMLNSPINGTLRFKVLYYLYIAYYWQKDATGVRDTINMMDALVKSNDEAMTEYKRDPQFYINNLSYASSYTDVPCWDQLTLSLCIHCSKPTNLKGLIEAIKKQSRKPDQVIIVSSGTRTLDIELEPGWLLCTRCDEVNMATNCNTLARLSTCDIISFIDANDLISEDYCEIIMQAFGKGADVVVHNSNSIISLKRSIFTKHQYDVNDNSSDNVELITRLSNAGYKFKHITNMLSFRQ